MGGYSEYAASAKAKLIAAWDHVQIERRSDGRYPDGAQMGVYLNAAEIAALLGHNIVPEMVDSVAEAMADIRRSVPEPECEHPGLGDTPAVGAWKCGSCAHITTDEPPMSKRECSYDGCATTFVAEERNCPQCNRPFSRLIAEHACEECEGDDPMEEVDAQQCPSCHEMVEVP